MTNLTPYQLWDLALVVGPTATAASAYGTAFGRLLPGVVVVVTPDSPLPSRRAPLRRTRLMPQPAIEAAGVSKTFQIPHERRTMFKEYFLHPFRASRLSDTTR